MIKTTMLPRIIKGLLFCLCGLSLSTASAAPTAKQTELHIAVAPFLPAHLIVKNYQPLHDYLENELKQPVAFITAPDYATFYQRTQRREYSVIITVAPIACLANADAGYIPMLRPVNLTAPVLLVGATSKITGMTELKGKVIGMPDELAIISMQGLDMLRAAGLMPENDLEIRHFPNHSTAVNYLVSGEISAAIVSDRALMQMPKDIQAKVRVIQRGDDTAAPGIFYLANPDLGTEYIQTLTTSIQKFIHQNPNGIKFIKKLGYGDLVPVSKEDLQSLSRYGLMFKTILEKQPQQ